MSAPTLSAVELRAERARNSRICALLAAAAEPYVRLTARGLYGHGNAWRDLSLEQLDHLHATILRRLAAREDAARAAAAQVLFSF